MAPAKKTPPKRPVKKAAARKATPAKRAPAKRAVARRPRVDTSKDLQVLELRRAGVPFDKIATQLGIRSRDAVADAYERALAETLPQPADDVRRLELDRLERLMTPLWPKAMRGDSNAIATLAKLSVDRTRVAADSRPLPEVAKDQPAGPVEESTLAEIARLRAGNNQLSATAILLARGLDETSGTNAAEIGGIRATMARELRMTMATLRGLAGTASAPDDGSGKSKKTETVVPPSRLEQLRQKAQDREQSRR